jgi:hypothetical protein
MFQNAEQIAAAANLYLPHRNTTGLDTGDVLRILNTGDSVPAGAGGGRYETGGAQSLPLLAFPQYRPNRRRPRPALTAEATDTGDLDLLLEESASRLYLTYRNTLYAAKWIRIILFAILVALVIKIIKN